MRLGTSNEDYRLQKRPLLGVLEITLAHLAHTNTAAWTYGY